MEHIAEYESLKNSGTFVECLKFVRSSPHADQIKNYLQQRETYDDIRVFLSYSFSVKDKQSLLEIVNKQNYPVGLRCKAVKDWLKLEDNEKLIHQFVVKNINDQQVPPKIKHQLLKCLHNALKPKKVSNSFFYDLAIELTKLNDHDSFNIDAYTLPFCSTAVQIKDLLERWSIQSFTEIDKTSALRSKLISYQQSISLDLIKNGMKKNYKNEREKQEYINKHHTILSSLAKKNFKQFCSWLVEYVKSLDENQRILPSAFRDQERKFFERFPNETIDLICEVSRFSPGKIKCESFYGYEEIISSLTFPRRFSVNHYVELFFRLYDSCKWSNNHFPQLLKVMLEKKTMTFYDLQKQHQWFYQIIVQQRIGKKIFIEKLLKHGDDETLSLIANYPDLSAPLAQHLLSKMALKDVVSSEQRLEYFRYEALSSETFEAFLKLFNKVRSNPDSRKTGYQILMKITTSCQDPTLIERVIQWITKCLTNERLSAIEKIIEFISNAPKQFLRLLLNHLQEIETIINLGLNHLESSNYTQGEIQRLCFKLLESVEHGSNEEQQKKVQDFVGDTMKRSFSMKPTTTIHPYVLKRTLMKTRSSLANLLINDIFPKFLSEEWADRLSAVVSNVENAWRFPQIDSLFESFFFDHLKNSTKLQCRFDLTQESSLISEFLKNRPTRSSRLQRLFETFGEKIFLNKTIQELMIRSGKYRLVFDQLISNEKSIKISEILDKKNPLAINSSWRVNDENIPGLYVTVLLKVIQYLTGDQQNRICKIILNDYIQNTDVSNKNKLQALKALRQMKHSYTISLPWIKEFKQTQTTIVKSAGGRGADCQSINDILICSPSTYDLFHDDLIEQFVSMKSKLNPANAKYISKAMLAISRKLSNELFLKYYLDFISSQEFQKTGITSNKEILRLLIHYRRDLTLIEKVIEPLWKTCPQQDVRVCLIEILLSFLKTASNNENLTMWSILDQAANDDYIQVIHVLFNKFLGPNGNLGGLSENQCRHYVDRIQLSILEKHKDIQARIFAWANINLQYCNANKLLNKAKEVSMDFEKLGNSCWSSALTNIIDCCKFQSLSCDALVEIFKSIIARRAELDKSDPNNQEDLPVYHRTIQWINQLNREVCKISGNKSIIRTIADLALQFDLNLANPAAELMLACANTKKELLDSITQLQNKLDSVYFQYILNEVTSTGGEMNDLCPLLETLDTEEKLSLIRELLQNNCALLFWPLITTMISEKIIEGETAWNLIQQCRTSSNMILREKSMHYTLESPDKIEDKSDCSSVEDMSTSVCSKN